MKKTLLIAATASFAAASALATDMPVKVPAYRAPIPMFSWTGFYGGAHGGYAWGQVTGNTVTNSLEQSGGFGGGQLGYNYQFAPNWVVGLEADVSGTGIDIRNAPLFAGFHNDLQVFGTARGRLGYAWDRLLLYGTGGFAWAHQHRIVPALPDSSNDHSGWTAGGGLEWAASNNVTWKIEYLYVDLNNRPYFPTAPSTAGWQGNTVKVGVNWLFH